MLVLRSELLRRVALVLIFCCLAFSVPTQAGTAWLERQKLLASDGAAEDRFGQPVSISGDYAIVGAPYDDDNGPESGSAYIFKWNGTSWVEQQKLLPSDGAADDYFGASVSISGDFAIVGAPFDNDNGVRSGSAYIFKWDGTSWSQQQKLLASDGNANDWFGGSVSINGDLAIVAAHGDEDNGIYSGSAYIFKADGTSWIEQAKLLASDGAAYDCFGHSVSISGDFAIVGVDSDDNNGLVDCGSVYIFTPNDIDPNNWDQQVKLLASDSAAGDYFGLSVSINGNFAIAGAPWEDDNGVRAGSAYIFKADGTSWIQQQKLLASDGAAHDNFGISVSISGDFAIVGAYHDDDDGYSSGSAYIFKWNGTNWSQQAKLLASDGAARDKFGVSVSISGDLAIVGAYWDDDNGDSSGSAYIFIPCADWLTADLNSDCLVDFYDFGIFAAQWLKCGDPCDPNCQP